VRLIELHGLEETAADPLQHGTLNLVPQALRIDNPAAGRRNNNLRNTHPSVRPVDLHICHDRGAFLRPVLAEGNSTTTHDRLASIRPARWPVLPASPLHRGVEHPQSHRVLKIVTAEFNRIRVLVGHDFIQEGFDREVALDASWCPKID
jgi:hypothetical protein